MLPEFLTGFRFIASIGPVLMGFLRISGIERQCGVETYQEGGVNDFVHLFPKPASEMHRLTMEKGVYTASYHPFYMVGKRLEVPLVIIVLTTGGLPGKTYIFNNCIVMKWQAGDLHASESKLLIDTFEVAYSDFFVQ